MTNQKPGAPLPLPEGFYQNQPKAKVPSQSSSTPTTSQCSHVVVAGDTLGKISARSSAGAAEIARLNGLTLKSIIRPGQVLQLPCVSGGKGQGVRQVQPSPLPVWTAKPGEYVTDVVERWAKRAGYTIVREGVEEWKVTVPISIQGNFRDALDELIVGFRGSGRPLAISIYSNKVLRIGRPI